MRRMVTLVWRRFGRHALVSGLCVVAAGCDLLPSDGPNANAVLSQAAARVKADPASVTRFALVDIDAKISREADRFYQPVASSMPAEFTRSGAFGRAGIGDVLKVTIWEAGDVGLFSRDRKGTDVMVRVDVDGTISLPYTGRFAVAGRRLSEIEATIVSKLASQASQPQATVIVADNVSSSVSVQGDVIKPGPYPVSKTNLRILDMIAFAGGAKYAPYETAVRVTRGRSTVVVGLQEVIDEPDGYNVPVAAGDAVLLSRKQQKFLALGAVVQPGEKFFTKATLTLSECLGQVLGLDSSRSDAMGVYLFRREPLDLARRYGIQLLPEDRGTVPVATKLPFEYWNST